MGPTFVRFQNFGRQTSSSPWWLIMAPGLMLISFGMAILIWPELLAYLVAFIILSLGITVTGWGWRLRQLERRQKKNFSAEQGTAQQASRNQRVVLNPGNAEPRASDTTIYYERR